MHLKTPKFLLDPMKMYRMGLDVLPKTYIEYHYLVSDLDIKNQGFTVVADLGLTSDGWMDGMKTRHLKIMDPKTYEVIEIKWVDGISPAWFKVGHGSTRFLEAKEETIVKINSIFKGE